VDESPEREYFELGETVPNGKLKGGSRWGNVRLRFNSESGEKREEERSLRWKRRRKQENERKKKKLSEAIGSRKESQIKKTVLETDTGGEVRNALRLKENECKGTRPIDSVTSGEGELAWR